MRLVVKACCPDCGGVWEFDADSRHMSDQDRLELSASMQVAICCEKCEQARMSQE